MGSENEFRRKVKAFIQKNKMLSYGDKVLVCLSGGADSVCLLRVICDLKDELGLVVYAAHVNHMLRAGDADSDESFCKSLCDKLGVELNVLRVDVAEAAKKTRQSVEAAARTIRYDYFFSLKKEKNIDKIVTAHNQNDNAETSLMYYMRGSGLDGIKGIAAKREDGVVRPLLCVSRKEIEKYLYKNEQDFVTDKTNFEDVYMRNKIRLNLIPELEKNYNPNLAKVISENALILSLDSQYMNEQARKICEKLFCDSHNGFYINIDEYNKIDKALSLRVIRYALARIRKSDKDISYDTVMRCDELFCDGETSKKVSISDMCFARREYDRVYFEKKSDEGLGYCYEVQIGSSIYIKEADVTFCLSVTDKMGKRRRNCEYFDYNLPSGQIYIRSRKNADVFIPFNMKGTKKLKDFFIDEKVDVKTRSRIPLVTCDDEILWVSGLRRSDLYKVSEKTTKILKIEFWEGK